MIHKILRGIVLVAFAAGLLACNTVKGVGKDLQKAGEKIEDSAEKHS
ncbi:MAG: entericidin A/B family lipoprotein [Xanthomonadales bacterium]|jgi:entericidin A|nr:entericidin A/B family lipoprotein [Xanthomonadales bacterium]MBK7145905.1 entericidin A/B family lipoprotein [Xanthomonadales bacterium]MCC6561196.1 entericidin A/B family lipoprotein [Xanthomonadales bacterium]